jgi:hypothetical protein
LWAYSISLIAFCIARSQFVFCNVIGATIRAPMLTIRREQFTALGRRLREPFAQSMVAHLCTHFPERCEALGTEALCETIHEGIERAVRCGITMQADVCRFIDIGFVLGADVDLEPWAQDILVRNAFPSGSARLKAFSDAAEQRAYG